MDFGERVLHLCFAKSGCTSAKLSKTSFQVLHSVCTDMITTRFCDFFGAGEQGVETGCGLAGLHVAGSLFVGVEAVD